MVIEESKRVAFTCIPSIVYSENHGVCYHSVFGVFGRALTIAPNMSLTEKSENQWGDLQTNSASDGRILYWSVALISPNPPVKTMRL